MGFEIYSSATQEVHVSAWSRCTSSGPSRISGLLCQPATVRITLSNFPRPITKCMRKRACKHRSRKKCSLLRASIIIDSTLELSTPSHHHQRSLYHSRQTLVSMYQQILRLYASNSEAAPITREQRTANQNQRRFFPKTDKLQQNHPITRSLNSNLFKVQPRTLSAFAQKRIYVRPGTQPAASLPHLRTYEPGALDLPAYPDLTRSSIRHHTRPGRRGVHAERVVRAVARPSA